MTENNLKSISGKQVAENQHSLTAGPRGPMLLQDVWFLEKMAHFGREVIPERRMHAKGSGAFGTFTTTHDVTKYTKAKIFSEIGKKTELFARFSTVAGERGAADAERDIRGFALKFYTEDGNWDMVGNNTPVFFIRDPLKFPDLNHAVKRDPQTNMRSAQNNWDFWTLLPESLHQVTITMSDRGIPLSYRFMDGFGSHTYSLYNEENEVFYVKFHFKTLQGLKHLTDAEAESIIAKDRESFQSDLFYAIKSGDYPRWKLYFQIMTYEESKNRKVNPFDIVRTWSEEEFPLIPVGMVELNRNPDNYFQDVEQSAFCPSNVVEGIGFSPDKMLQGRILAYKDTQMYRLGVNHQSIPVNAPMAPVKYYHRDGQMRVDGNFGATKGYEPNSYGQWQELKECGEPPLEIFGDAYHYNPSWDKYDDIYEEPGQLYRTMTEDEKTRLIGNTMRSISPTTENIKYRHASQCYKADKDYGKRLSNALSLEMSLVIELSKMSEVDRKKATIPAK